MLKVKKHGVILKPTSLPFENVAVLNPAVYQEDERVHIFYRAINHHYHSSIGYALLEGPKRVIKRWKKPIFQSKYAYESKGVEDPRIVKIGNCFYLTYVAHNGKNAVTAYATSQNLKTFQRHGIISPKITYHEAEKLFEKSKLKDAYYLFSAYYQKRAGRDILIWEKDMILFPKKIKKNFALLHRILPDIQLAYFRHFKQLNNAFWRRHIQNLQKHVVLENKHWFETRNIGGGCPPIETPDGWILIYHAVEESNHGRIYHASAVLLDKRNPQKVIAHLHRPLFSPTEPWEKSGFVSNVVFPTGTAIFGQDLYIYYGAADKYVAVASVNIVDLIHEMKNSPHDHPYAKKRRK